MICKILCLLQEDSDLSIIILSLNVVLLQTSRRCGIALEFHKAIHILHRRLCNR